MPGGPSIEELVTREAAGWQFSRTKLTDEFSLKDHLAARPDNAERLAVLKPDKRLLFFSTDARPATEAGDVLISYVDRQSVVWGKGVSLGVARGVTRRITKKNK